MGQSVAEVGHQRVGYRTVSFDSRMRIDGEERRTAASFDKPTERVGEIEENIDELAKRFEEVFVPERSEPVRIPRGSEALYMLQVVRDEAHRFANSFHRERRSMRMRASELDGIRGLGPKRRESLLAVLGGIAGVRAASAEQLAELLPTDVANAVHERLHPPQ